MNAFEEAEEKRKAHWKALMQEWAILWFREVVDFDAIQARPVTWRYGAWYAEMRRVVNGRSHRKYPESEALNAAIRCRNRLWNKPVFE